MKLPLNKNIFNSKGIQFTLFYECNLNCKFCFQKRIKSNPITDEVKSIVQNNINKIDKYISTCKYNTIDYKILGGEIFSSFMDWSWFNNIINQLIDICIKYNKIPTFVFMTNLIHNEAVRINVDKIIAFLSKSNIKFVIAPSFDIWGRFNNVTMLDIFYNNCKHYKPYLGNINMVLSKPTCELLLNIKQPNEIESQCIELYKKLYNEDYIMDVDYYAARNIPDDPLMPGDSLLLNTLIYLYHNFNKIRLLRTFNIEDEPKLINCRSELQVEYDKFTESCMDFYNQQNNPNLITKSGENYKERLISNFIHKKQCLMCKWYKHCPMGCFFYFDNIMHKDYNGCIYKELFSNINNDKSKQC